MEQTELVQEAVHLVQGRLEDVALEAVGEQRVGHGQARQRLGGDRAHHGTLAPSHGVDLAPV